MENSSWGQAMILMAFGTRPEYIKIKPLIEEMQGKIPFKLLFTGQHVDLLSNVADQDVVKLEIKDGQNRLDSIVSSVMNQDHIFEGIDAVLVQGDTTSVFAIALAAFHRRIKVVHLEAGLRTYDKENHIQKNSTDKPSLASPIFTYVLPLTRRITSVWSL